MCFCVLRMSVAKRYVQCLNSRGRLFPALVLVVWVAMAITGASLTPLFFKATSNDMGIPTDAPSLLALQMGSRGGLQQRDGKLRLTVMVESCCVAVASSNAVAKFYGNLKTMLEHRFGEGAIEWSGFMAALAAGETQMAQGYIGKPEGRTGLLVLDVNASVTPVDAVARYLHQELPFLSRTSENASVVGTVLGDAMNKDVIIGSVQNDLALGDGIAMPISLFVLGVTLRSFRLLLIPIVCFAVSALTTYGLMFGVASAIPVISAAASLVSSILIAFSFDYCLFQLSRFVELCKAQEGGGGGGSSRDSHASLVEKVLETAGHTCLVSGGTLFLSFACLILIPQQVLRGFAAASCAALFVIILCQLSVVPSMLLLFPNFFGSLHATCPGFVPQRLQRWWLRSDEAEQTEEQQMKSSIWFRLGEKITIPPWNWVVLLAVVALVVPFAVFSFGWPVNDSLLSALPRGDEFTAAVMRLLDAFGKDYLEHYYLVVTQAPHAAFASPLDPKFVESVHSLLDQLHGKIGRISCESWSTYVSAG